MGWRRICTRLLPTCYCHPWVESLVRRWLLKTWRLGRLKCQHVKTIASILCIFLVPLVGSPLGLVLRRKGVFQRVLGQYFRARQ